MTRVISPLPGVSVPVQGAKRSGGWEQTCTPVVSVTLSLMDPAFSVYRFSTGADITLVH